MTTKYDDLQNMVHHLTILAPEVIAYMIACPTPLISSEWCQLTERQQIVKRHSISWVDSQQWRHLTNTVIITMETRRSWLTHLKVKRETFRDIRMKKNVLTQCRLMTYVCLRKQDQHCLIKWFVVHMATSDYQANSYVLSVETLTPV